MIYTCDKCKQKNHCELKRNYTNLCNLLRVTVECSQDNADYICDFSFGLRCDFYAEDKYKELGDRER